MSAWFVSAFLSGKRWLLGLALLAVVCVYAPLLGSYYCGFDDFTEVYTAAHGDSDDPSRIFTTTHQGTPKYRPINRLVILLSYHLGNGEPWLLRWRNLGGHLLCMLALFQLARMAGQSAAGAALVAAAFGLHPLAHQSVAAASWTNTLSYSGALWSWWLLASAWGQPRPQLRLAAGSLLLLLALFAYEPTIVVLGPVTLDLVWRRWRRQSPPGGWRSYLLWLGSGVGLTLGLFVVARAVFVSGRMPLTPPLTLVKNLALYVGSLALPVDLLLLNSLSGFPLPSQVVGDSAALFRLALLCAIPVATAAVLLLWFRRNSPQKALASDSNAWSWIWLVSIPMALSPFLLNTDHASETYQYLPVALLCLFVGGQVERWIEPKASLVVVMVFLGLSGWAAALRSGRVSACGATAHTVLRSLPLTEWKSGEPVLFFKNPDNYTPPPRFGLYSLYGMATIDTQTDNIPALQAALRVASGNRRLRARAVDAERYAAECAAPGVNCYVVYPDGHSQRTH